ncbi:MAG: alpha/beta hydrolase [Bryobacteraceae bacterium]
MYVDSRGSGPPILFVHGIPTSGQLWRGVIDRLAGKFTCIAIDLPGLGRSPGTPGGLSRIDAIVDSIENLREQLNFDRWHIVGHDAGSAIAVKYAQRFPERVSGLALLTPSIFPDLKPYYLFQLLRRPLIGELMAPLVNLIFWNVAMRLAVGAAGRTVMRDFHAPFSGWRGAWHLMSILRWGNPSQVLASIPLALPEIRVPTVIFQGSRDVAIPQGFARRAADLLPNSKLVMLDSGHFIPLNKPACVAEELLMFFN